MKEKLKYILTTGNCPPMDDLQLYHHGKLSSDKKFGIENHIAGCEICTDILEGLSLINSENHLKKSEKEIEDRLGILLQGSKKKRFLITYKKFAVAASILLIAGGLFTVYNIYTSSEEIGKVKNTLTETKITEKNAPVVADNEEPEIKAKAGKNEEKQIPVKEKPLNESSGLEDQELEKSSEIMLSAEENETYDTQYEVELPATEPSTSGQQAYKEDVEIRAKEAEKKIIVWNDDEKIVEGKRTITGKVIDETGSPLPGVNVVVKGTKSATITDISGSYRIEVPEEGSVLQFNYIGFMTQEAQIQTQDKIQIAMTPDVSSLEEVVVIGYGTRKRLSAARATSKADAKEDLSYANEHKTELLNQIDSLQKSLKSKGEDALIRKALSEKYLELEYRSDAIKELTALKNLLSDTSDIASVNDIIEFTKNKDFNTALSMLRDLKPE